jgi:periplasmic protein TonB
MELKKNPGSDLRRWSAPLFHLGLVVAVGSVLVAFEWKAKEEKPLITLTGNESIWDDATIPITVQTPPLPPPPVLPNPVIKSVTDTEKVVENTNWDLNLPSDVLIPEVKLEGPPVVEKGDEILDFTEEKAEFIGGMEAWYRYLKDKLSYPKLAQKMGEEGTVLVRFVINTDGSIQDVEVVRSVHPLLDQAAVNVIESSPQWKPAKHLGKLVRTRMTIPIKFKLN